MIIRWILSESERRRQGEGARISGSASKIDEEPGREKDDSCGRRCMPLEDQAIPVVPNVAGDDHDVIDKMAVVRENNIPEP